IVTKGSRRDRTGTERGGGGQGKYHHILLLAKDLQGYRNLMKLCTLGHTEGFYAKPRIDVEILQQYRAGIVCTSACPGGIVGAHLKEDRYDDAREYAGIYKEIFGEDFYIEIQDHGMDVEKLILRDAPRLARELGLKLVATNDCHYIAPDHAMPHNIMLAIPDATSSFTPDISKLRYGTDQLYFKSAAEMHRLFHETPEALRSTLEIAERCNVVLDLKSNYMPDFPIPPDAGVTDANTYFEKLAREGIHRRYASVTPEIQSRLDLEISTIQRMGYAGYFLIVQDFIAAARSKGVRVGPGRGSAAGSIVSYALGITNVDPLHYDLLFERFLNPERISMPDIDIDFADDKREQVISYVREKYGEGSVAQIITFGTLSARAVLKDIGRVLGIPLGTIDSITKQIPVIQGKVTPIAEALDTIPDLKWVKESPDEKIQLLIKTAKVLEGMNRNVSTHAAGVVIAPGEISDFVPMYKTPQSDLMTQYNMKDLEDAGLLKMDFLGLRTLTVLDDALAMVKADHGIDVDLDDLPHPDKSTFELFGKGQTVAIFQFESSGMQDYLRKLKPSTIYDLVAMNALYRPGPMENIPDFIDRKHGRQKITYLHPKLEPILRDTYGVIVYQEQVMKIASEIGGFTLAQADLLRRAMGKKDKKLMEDQKARFVKNAVEHGTEAKIAGEIFDLIEKFASYGFNKSHSVAYSVLAYQTAYLKAHYPAEYMAATMSSEVGNTDKIVLFIDDCRKLGIDVLPPDVNESGVSFVVTPKGIRFGMSAIKGVGVSAVEDIVRARTKDGRFQDLFDFAARVDLRLNNKRSLEAMVQAGAFDSLHDNRAQLFVHLEAAIAYGQSMQEQSGRGQSNLFDGGGTTVQLRPVLRTVDRWTEVEQLQREKSVLGFYVSGHPLLRYTDEIEGFGSAVLGSPETVKPNATLRVFGIVSDLKKKIDKRGNMMAFVTLEDFTGKADCIVFSDPYQKYAKLLEPGSIVMVVGKNDGTVDQIKIIVNEVVAIGDVRQKFTKNVLVTLRHDSATPDTVRSLAGVLEQHPGKCPCYLNMAGGGTNGKSLYLAIKFTVNPDSRFTDAVRRLLGPGSVRLQ
ncbi:MAG: DNA polymerase III subunit alpha, partial [Bacteroidota bacterium]